MLAISRRPGQAIFVYPADDVDPNMTVGELFAGGPIKIMTDVKNGQVKVGIAAPRHLTVLREELVKGRSPASGAVAASDAQLRDKPDRVDAEAGAETAPARATGSGRD